MTTVTNVLKDHNVFTFSLKHESASEGRKPDPKDEGTTLLQNTGNYIPNDRM
jgi:hypothetical protein